MESKLLENLCTLVQKCDYMHEYTNWKEIVTLDNPLSDSTHKYCDQADNG